MLYTPKSTQGPRSPASGTSVGPVPSVQTLALGLVGALAAFSGRYAHPCHDTLRSSHTCTYRLGEATCPGHAHRDVDLLTPRLLGASLATVDRDRVDWE